MSDKTEEPTPKRLRRAREDGDSPLSAFASQALAFVCVIAVVPAAVVALAERTSVDLRSAIAHAGDASPAIAFVPLTLATVVLTLVAPILVVSALASGAASIVQTGGVVSTKKLTPDLAKLDPIAGLRQLVSPQRLIVVLRAGIFATAVACFLYAALRANAPALAHSAGQLEAATVVARTLALEVAKKSAAVGLFLAVIDIVVTRRAWHKKLMMTKAEVKREHRESDGDPQLKATRERAHHELLASVTIANVKSASVIVVNPTHIACALRYQEDDGDEAPVLVASGQGDLAKRIVQAAEQYGIPVLQDVPLARALVELEVGDEIPEVLYEAVAEILKSLASVE